MKKFNFIIWALVIQVIASCSGVEPEETEVPPMAFFSLYQASPDAPDLSISVDANQITTVPFRYGNFTDYVPVSLGLHSISINSLSGTPVASEQVTFVDQDLFSLFVVNRFSTVDLVAFKDNTTAKPSSGMAMIRFINLSPDASVVDLVATGATEASIFSNTAYLQASPFKEIDANFHNLEVRVAGTTTPLALENKASIGEGNFYTVIFQGVTGDMDIKIIGMQ